MAPEEIWPGALPGLQQEEHLQGRGSSAAGTPATGKGPGPSAQQQSGSKAGVAASSPKGSRAAQVEAAEQESDSDDESLEAYDISEDPAAEAWAKADPK